MDLSKMYEFFKPETVQGNIHIIGCGSVGSTLADLLARCGLTNFTLWDFDTVEPHNIHNQMFVQADVGRAKVDAVKDNIIRINPDANVSVKPDGWNEDALSGYVFLCVDDIDLRRKIVESNMNNMFLKAVFDFRTALQSAQHYAADWMDYNQKQRLLSTMQFSHEEAAEATPTSACGRTIGVVTTVRLVCDLGVNNFLSFVKGDGIKKAVLVDGFQFTLDAF